MKNDHSPSNMIDALFKCATESGKKQEMASIIHSYLKSLSSEEFAECLGVASANMKTKDLEIVLRFPLGL